MPFKITPAALKIAQRYAASTATVAPSTGFTVTPQALKEAEQYAGQTPSFLDKTGSYLKNTAMGAVNDINNLGGGLVHGASVPIAGAENLAGDVISHVPGLQSAGN